ncbi:MAG: hypothetical protein IPP78_02460 [Holophagaceae bacterium]|nr:hypothetical protein [Holophagaceae bacterium]
MVWQREGRTCGNGETFHGANLLEGAKIQPLLRGGGLDLLNVDISAVVGGHADIERLAALRLYNRAMTELIFRVLWRKTGAV